MAPGGCVWITGNNDVTVKDAYPLLCIKEALKKSKMLAGSQLEYKIDFSTLVAH